jgi:hypothetical protein
MEVWRNLQQPGRFIHVSGRLGEERSLFFESLALEKQYYNLNGISVCYNNLGGLMDDKGDPAKSLYYLKKR